MLVSAGRPTFAFVLRTCKGKPLNHISLPFLSHVESNTALGISFPAVTIQIGVIKAKRTVKVHAADIGLILPQQKTHQDIAGKLSPLELLSLLLLKRG